MTCAVSVRELRIEYQLATSETFCAIGGVSFDVGAGELLAIVGPSGCGKSSVLSALAGLIPVTAGHVEVDGKEVSGPGNGCAVVFQGPTLLPWRNVEGNIELGLEPLGLSKSERRARVAAALDLVGLEQFARSFPYQLSGGMQQRVNVARALVVQPKVLLLDEPFGALDAQTRERMQREFERLWITTGLTAIFVTHDVQEAVSLADRVMVFSPGPGSTVKEVVDVVAQRPRLEGIDEAPELGDYVGKVRRALWT